MITITVIVAFIIGLATYCILMYNHLVALKNTVAKNWSNIDVLLKQRYSELPKLVDTCKHYMQYEQSTLEQIVQARNTAASAREQQDVNGLSKAESLLQMGLGKLFALAENYPELKANESFQKLQTRISELENSISDRRELYNESVNLNNIRIEQFPDVLIAKAFHFGPHPLLTFHENEKKDIDLNRQFS